MTAHKIFDDAMKLLGYTDYSGEIDDSTGLKARATAVINRILSDLNIDISINKLSDKIEASKEAEDALIYGTAMLLALSDNDGGKNKLFAEIYNGKRAFVKGNKSLVGDTLPVVSEV